jgi:hypothetical protein
VSVVRSAVCALALITFACSDPSGATDDDGFDEFETENFLFFHTPSDVAALPALAAEFDAHRERIMADLGVDSVPQVLVYLYPNRRAFLTAHPNLESWVTGFTEGRRRMHIISPNAPNQVYELWPHSRAAHMLTHLVTLRINRDADDNPRWLWESIALYESNERRDPRGEQFFSPEYSPQLAELNGGIASPLYRVGYLLGEFIAE